VWGRDAPHGENLGESVCSVGGCVLSASWRQTWDMPPHRPQPARKKRARPRLAAPADQFLVGSVCWHMKRDGQNNNITRSNRLK